MAAKTVALIIVQKLGLHIGIYFISPLGLCGLILFSDY
jgi:hypothetical protein